MFWIKWGSIMMFVGVALGAFGAHGLKDLLSGEAKEVYQTGVLYHLIHGLGLLAVGWMAITRSSEPTVRLAGWAFLIGILLFSGSLYGLSLTGIKKLGMITPVGGLAFLIGWISLAWAAK